MLLIELDWRLEGIVKTLETFHILTRLLPCDQEDF